MSVTRYRRLMASPAVAMAWDRETVPWSVAPETAWEEGYPLYDRSYPVAHRGTLPVDLLDSVDIESVRYHEITETLLVRKGLSLVECRCLGRPLTRDDLELRAHVEEKAHEFVRCSNV